MVINYRVSRDFIKYPDSDLDEFANGVSVALDGNTSFPTPPYAADAVETFDQTFRDAIAAATGDPQNTLAKNKARETLLDVLRRNGNYVESLASHDLQKLLSSGYYAVSTNRVQAPLNQPVIMDIENLATTQLLLRLTPVLNARSYHLQTNTNGNGTWQEAGIYTQARRVVLTNLTPGTTYSVRARAIGGSTGYSEWSVPASLMAT